jgi:hypothetical protein
MPGLDPGIHENAGAASGLARLGVFPHPANRQSRLNVIISVLEKIFSGPHLPPKRSGGPDLEPHYIFPGTNAVGLCRSNEPMVADRGG